jgi:hypothetical protein
MPINNSPTAPLVGGNSSRNPILSGYVFQSGIHKPEHSSILTYKYPQYYMTTMLDRLGASEAKGQDLFSWNILDRTRESATLSTITSGGTTSDAVGVWTTDQAITSTDLGYFLVNDVVRLPSGDLARITASADTGGFQAITVVKVGSGNWTNTVAVTDRIGHAFSAFPEASSAPTGRLYLPTEDYNVMTINRRSFKISGSEFTNRTYLGDGKSWYFNIEDIEMKEFAKDNEHIIMFGDLDETANSVSRGVLDWAIASGVNNGFVGATGVSEANLRNHIKELVLQGVSNEIFVLCGIQFLADVQVALIDYAIDGALSYGSFGNNTAGLDFQSYKFLGKTVNFMHYELFNDESVVPVDTAGAATNVYDFSNFSLWLDLGSTSNGQKLITLCHKELDGQSRKFIHAYEVGMMNPDGTNGGNVANGDDAFTIHYLSETSVKVLNPERLGILAATS